MGDHSRTEQHDGRRRHGAVAYAGRVNESIAIDDGDFLLAHQLVADIRSATGTDWDIATGDMWSGFIRLRIADSWDFDSQDAIPPAHTR